MAAKGSSKEARENRDRLRAYSARQSVHAHQVARRTRDNRRALIGLAGVAILAAVVQIAYFTLGPGTPEPVPTASATPEPTPSAGTNVGDIPDPAVAESRTWTGTITLNDVALGVELDGAAAPQSVASFITDSADYLPGKPCHRLVLSETARLLQCGAEDTAGTADPNYRFGPIENAPETDTYRAGTIAMARIGGDAYSQGHQFFIVLSDTILPADAAGGYSVIGRVTSGLSELDAALTRDGIAAGGSSAQDGPPAVAWTISSISLQ